MTLFYLLIVLFFTITGTIVTGMAVGTVTTLTEKFDPTIPQVLLIALLGGLGLGLITYIIFIGVPA